MAPLPEIEDTYRVCFKWKPLVACNVMHFHMETGAAAGLWTIIQAHVKANMWMFVATSQSVGQVQITKLDGVSPTVNFTAPTSSVWTGQGSGDADPNTAAVLSMHTALRGRSARGRAYLGPAGEAVTTAGMLSSTNIGLCETAWTAFQTELIAADVQQVVASYKLGSALTVINYTIRPAAGTVRLRQSRLASP